MIREAGGGPMRPQLLCLALADPARSGQADGPPAPHVAPQPRIALMSSAPLDFSSLLATGLPPPAIKYNGFPKYNFVGGHNDAEHLPVDALVAAATSVLTREGRTLATYGLESGPQGYRPLREFLVGKLRRDAGI